MSFVDIMTTKSLTWVSEICHINKDKERERERERNRERERVKKGKEREKRKRERLGAWVTT